MKLMIKYSTVLSLAALFMTSCAKRVEESSTVVEQRYIDAYVQEHYLKFPEKYPDAGFKPSGLFFIEKLATGAGTLTPVTGDTLYMRYTVRDASGNIAQTSVDSLAELLGTHSYQTYYGPQIFSMAEGGGMLGFQEAFKEMKKGDKVRILMPSWLSSYTSGGSTSWSAMTICDLELMCVIPAGTMAAFQANSLQKFAERYNNVEVVDTLPNWYFTELTPSTVTEPLPAEGDTIKLRYAGYLLDGFMFDTNIKDTAVFEAAKYGEKISSSATFNQLTVIYKSTVTDMDVVPGFGHALGRMREGSEAVVFFSSDYGYGATGSGQIPAYAMLRFYIKIESIGRVYPTTN